MRAARRAVCRRRDDRRRAAAQPRPHRARCWRGANVTISRSGDEISVDPRRRADAARALSRSPAILRRRRSRSPPACSSPGRACSCARAASTGRAPASCGSSSAWAAIALGDLERAPGARDPDGRAGDRHRRALRPAASERWSSRTRCRSRSTSCRSSRCSAASRKARRSCAAPRSCAVKESDRIESVVGGLRGLGAEIEATGDGFAVRGTGGLRGGAIASHGDHRLAMLGAVAGPGLTRGRRGRAAWRPPTSRIPGFLDGSRRAASGERSTRSPYLVAVPDSAPTDRNERAAAPERPSARLQPPEDGPSWPRVEPSPRRPRRAARARSRCCRARPPRADRAVRRAARAELRLRVRHRPAGERTQVPYSPFFLEQVERGNVQEIATRGETIKAASRRRRLQAAGRTRP